MSPRAELAAAALAAPIVTAIARRRPRALVRTAASGRETTLAAGPATLAGLLAATVVDRRPDHRAAGPTAVAVLAAAAAGAVDDLVEARFTGGAVPPRGLGGHLRALRSGRVTTGAVKTVVIGAGALAAASALAGLRDHPGAPARRPARPIPAVVRLLFDSALIAGTANLLNLFDLRPGRAGKVALVLTAALVLTGSGPPPGILGTLAGTLPGDLRGAWMLGDTGANALGAALGVRVAARGGPGARAGWLGVVLALTAASERVSFTEVIAGNPLLRAADDLGRR